ncbi:MAG: error-prone DNA polymerase, partial [Verrucomicrobiaceae bacterium]
LEITNVDPIENKLLFERFLNASRKGQHDDNRRSWPDIDIDFPSGDQREKVIQYVFNKYGNRGAAMTANVITYRSRSAFREMSKVLGLPISVADRFSKESSGFRYFPEDRKGLPPEEKKEKAAADFEERMASLLPPSHPALPALQKLYGGVLGLPRHLGQHSGGIIICSKGLDAIVPIEPATMENRTVVQWDKDDCQDLGIVKIDLLGLGILAAMQDSIEICKKRGTNIDLAHLDLGDKAVYDMLEAADTIGTFQVESRAQMATLPILKPKNFYDIAVEVAIIRPGPIVGDLLHPYLRRRMEKESNPNFKPDCIHELCEPILERTLGVPLFQEQMLGMAMAVAKFSGTEADELRRALAFNRNDDRMEKVLIKLKERMTENNVAKDVQEKIIHATGTFALYGFPESHAISFAHLAFSSCWLKVHQPAAFYTGLINNQPMGFYSVNTLLQDAKHRGIRVLPVCCVQGDGVTEVVDDRTIRLGLNRLKNVGKATIARILQERGVREFDSLEDFLQRVKPGEKERRALARGGALNGLPKVLHRRQAMWQAELPLHDDLFHAEVSEFPEMIPAMTLAERLSSDYAVQGASSGPHPMKVWRESVANKKLQRAKDLHILPGGIPVVVGGMAICRQRPGTAKGHCFISLEDETGIANLFVPRETFHRFRQIIVTEPFLLAKGRLQRSRGGDQPTVFVTDIAPLEGTDPSQAAASHDFH